MQQTAIDRCVHAAACGVSPPCWCAHSLFLMHLTTYSVALCAFNRVQQQPAPCLTCLSAASIRSHTVFLMDSSAHAQVPTDDACYNGSHSNNRGKGGSTGVYLKGSPELNYGLGIASTQMATAQIRCSSGDIYNESIS